MKIIVYFFPTGAFDQISTTRNYIDELCRHGHNVVVVNPYEKLGLGLEKQHYDEYLIERITRENNQESIDIFFAHLRDNEIEADTVLRIRELGIKTVNATYDHLFVHHRSKKIAKSFDLYWVTEPEAVEIFESYGARVFFAPTAANPWIYHPNKIKEDIDISFCGTNRESRPYYMEALFQNKVDVHVFGSRWGQADENNGVTTSKKRTTSLISTTLHVANSLTHKYGRKWLYSAVMRRIKNEDYHFNQSHRLGKFIHPPLSFPDMVALFSRSKISLGINELGHTYLTKSPLFLPRLRDFEAPMSGACYIMRRLPHMRDHFVEDEEMLFYDTIEELIEKVRFYSHPDHETLRKKIKQKARARALRDHTWKNRFSKICEELGMRHST
ncbi:MAG: hypothetical protein CMF52_02455 [Legionellales bacterium]|nr:hypothetical protein [Legionellales bacterium]